MNGGMVFGPVHSRRLGVSLGINNIPYKTCTYTCVYCQLGRTIKLSIEGKPYSDPIVILRETVRVLEGVKHVDYVTFVPDGEPTLDSNLGRAIRLLKSELGVSVAVLTNASLLFLREVYEDVMEADLVSLKVDAGRISTWKRINRPHPDLKYEEVVEGILAFSRDYTGTIITETMLVKGLNDYIEELEEIASLLVKISPRKAYITIPHRPPAEEWVKPPSMEEVVKGYETIRERGLDACILAYPEPPPPPPEQTSLLEWVESTAKVHPLPLDYLAILAGKRGLTITEILEPLVNKGYVIIEYSGKRFLTYRPNRTQAKR